MTGPLPLIDADAARRALLDAALALPEDATARTPHSLMSAYREARMGRLSRSEFWAAVTTALRVPHMPDGEDPSRVRYDMEQDAEELFGGQYSVGRGVVLLERALFPAAMATPGAGWEHGYEDGDCDARWRARARRIDRAVARAMGRAA